MEQKKALTNQSAQHSGRITRFEPAQRMQFVEYLHTRDKAHFSRAEMAQMLVDQTGLRYAPTYLPTLLKALSLRCYKPRPHSARRPQQAAAAQ